MTHHRYNGEVGDGMIVQNPDIPKWAIVVMNADRVVMVVDWRTGRIMMEIAREHTNP